MEAKTTIVIVILGAVFVAFLLSYNLLSPRIKRRVPITSDFGKVSLLLLVVVGINFGQSFWILFERKNPSFPIPGNNYRILPRNFSDFNSLSQSISTLNSIQNLYIALDGLTTAPQIFSIDEEIPSDAENQSKLFGTVWPKNDIRVLHTIGKDDLKAAIKDMLPRRAGTVYATLKKTDPGIDWKIYSSTNNASTQNIVVFSETNGERRVWTFIDARLLTREIREELQI